MFFGVDLEFSWGGDGKWMKGNGRSYGHHHSRLICFWPVYCSDAMIQSPVRFLQGDGGRKERNDAMDPSSMKTGSEEAIFCPQ